MAEFKRHHRIVKAGHFRAVFENRQRVHGRFFSFHLLPNAVEFHRLGLAVSKKVSRKAVERNRIKRHVREAFRHLQQQQQAAQGLCGVKTAANIAGIDLVVVAKPAASGIDGNLLQREIASHWERLTGIETASRVSTGSNNREHSSNKQAGRCGRH